MKQSVDGSLEHDPIAYRYFLGKDGPTQVNFKNTMENLFYLLFLNVE